MTSKIWQLIGSVLVEKFNMKVEKGKKLIKLIKVFTISVTIYMIISLILLSTILWKIS